MVPTPSSANNGYDHHGDDVKVEGEADLKRTPESSDISRPAKKMRMDSSPGIAGIP
jgi:hypothetical protein